MTIVNGIEEKILIERLFESDQTAFELLFRYYYPGLVVYVKNIVIDEAEAEEIVQDFFVQLWIARKKIKKSSSLKNFFFVSVKNRAFNYLKKKQINEKIFNELTHLVETDMLYIPDLFVQSELQNEINNAFNHLPPRTREIFMLSRIKGLSNEEIAGELNISKRTVETQISNALKKLRVELKEYAFLALILGIASF